MQQGTKHRSGQWQWLEVGLDPATAGHGLAPPATLLGGGGGDCLGDHRRASRPNKPLAILASMAVGLAVDQAAIHTATQLAAWMVAVRNQLLQYQLCHLGRCCLTKSEINDRRS